MAREAKAVFQKSGSSYTIYLRKGLVEDSAFPLKPDDTLLAKIEGRRLVIERQK